ncbi:MAG TPA: hypothetical protein VMF61_13230, partial [Candidatus Acidoferrales bacterium]|nr:hypothetical protein [Candidatus Acidoferrales bacterium]
MASRTFERPLSLAISATIVAIFVAFTVAKGVPAMRHDWWMSADPAALRAAAASSLSTWRNDGLGGPTLYPNDYLFYAAILALAVALPPVAVLGAFAALVGIVAVAAARTFSNGGVARCALSAILLFNPWTYTELVAGHLPMLLSYAGSAWFAAECTRGKSASPLRLCVAAVAVVQQLQFFAVLVPATLLLWFLGGLWQPFAVAAIAGIPVVIGVALGYGDLQAIPYTLDWERNQSLHAPAALALGGYFAQYDAALGWLGELGGTLFASVAAAGLVLARDRRAIATAIALALLFAFALGTNGPLAGAYAFAVTHVKATALFRELYDLLAYAAIGYAALIAAGSSRARWMAIASAVTAAVALASWCLAPPARFWVPSAAIPISTIAVPPNVRFALLPAFQPLQFHGSGSGTDPDVFNRPNDVAPVNAYIPSYPTVTALARYASDRDDAPLRGLSVGEIVSRPWLCTDVPSLRAQVKSRPIAQACGESVPAKHLNAVGELTVQSRYAVGTLLTNVGGGNVLAVDAARAGLIGPDALRTIVPAAPTPGTDPSDGWVDARLFFATHAAFGQPYGGAYTTSPAQPLSLARGDRILALVRGALLDAATGRRIGGGNAREFRWLQPPADAGAVRCAGECVVAAEGPPLPF